MGPSERHLPLSYGPSALRADECHASSVKNDFLYSAGGQKNRRASPPLSAHLLPAKSSIRHLDAAERSRTNEIRTAPRKLINRLNVTGLIRLRLMSPTQADKSGRGGGGICCDTLSCFRKSARRKAIYSSKLALKALNRITAPTRPLNLCHSNS